MKKLFTYICSLILLLSSALPIYARDTSNKNVYYSSSNISENLNELDPYIQVKDNRYVLTLPSNVILSDELECKVDESLKVANEFIKKNNYEIGSNKIAHPKNEIIPMVYGRNAFYIHWNYFEIWMDAGLVKNVVNAGVTGVITAIVAAIPPFAAWIAANPTLAPAIVAFATTLISNISGDMINNGIIVHYNWIMQKITYIGLQ